ncbi:MAG TPA: hypothetical protein VEZ50_15930 [Nodosilinea sp.]|nr:hypothetical protein [Nodosilinea sp.]
MFGFRSEEEINRHYDKKIEGLQAEISATEQRIENLNASHERFNARMDRLAEQSRGRARAAREKVEKAEAAFFAKYGRKP